MKKHLLIIFIAICSLQVFAQDQILGTYWSPKKDGQIIIYKEKDQYFGKISPNFGKPSKDTKNPDQKLRSRDMQGLVILTNFKYQDGKWVDGQIYDPNSGKTYSCTMYFDKNDTKHLNIRGYIGISLLGRSEVFERIENTK
jgi:uncharacterized protein (DUF2147 family)